MAFSVRKLRFPDDLLKIDYSLSLFQDGVSEDGEPLEAITSKGKCIFSEKAKRIIDSEGKQITLLGKVIVKGDIAQDLTNISDGTIEINGRTYEIYAGYRPRNPDGTINHTMFEVK